MILKKIAVVIVFLSIASIGSFAQKNEASLTVGVMGTGDQRANNAGIVCPPICNTLNASSMIGDAIDAAYTRQLVDIGPASLDVELPVIIVPGRDIEVTGPITFTPITFSRSAVFFTPSARVKFLHSGPVSPFFSVGGGLAHFGTSLNIGAFGFDSTDTWAVQLGAGLDFKTPLRHLAVRVNFRDLYSEGPFVPSSVLHVAQEHKHNLFAGLGFVVKF